MATSRRRAKPLAVQMAELALAAPQVVGHRVTRMALAGASPSARDRREFHQMGAEKLAAMGESWFAMWVQAFHAQQQLALGMMKTAALPTTAALTRAGLGVLGHGLAPVHQRAVANSKRLARTKLKLR